MINEKINTEKKQKVMIFAGGTLGHVNPALVISKLFYQNNYDVDFITTDNKSIKSYISGNNYLVKNAFNKIFYFDSPGFNSKQIFKNIKSLLILLKTKHEINKLIKKEKPNMVIGFGGSISTLGLMSAKNKKIISCLHEQNAIVGRGNKFISFLNKKVHKFSAFEINDYFYVGNPLITDSFERKTLNKKDMVLIYGGSNGSTKINDFFIENYESLFFGLDIYLITGDKYYEDNRNKDRINKHYGRLKILNHTSNMNTYYNRASYVVSRAGAGALSEIIGYQIPSIVIPSPNVTNNHQYYNAVSLEKDFQIVVLEEKDLSLENFTLKIKELKEKEENKNNEVKQIYLSKYIFFDALEFLIKEGDK